MQGGTCNLIENTRRAKFSIFMPRLEYEISSMIYVCPVVLPRCKIYLVGSTPYTTKTGPSVLLEEAGELRTVDCAREWTKQIANAGPM